MAKCFPNEMALKCFSPNEFKHPDKMDCAVLTQLDHMRCKEGEHRNIIITINSDFRPGDPKFHGQGLALDIVIWDAITKDPLPLLEQFFIASRYGWRGIGLYPFWKRPGIHIDLRPPLGKHHGRRSFWWKDSLGKFRTMKAFAEFMGR